MRLLRALRIVHAIGTHGLDEFLPRGRSTALLRAFVAVAYPGRRRGGPRGVRLRRALESLGPVFVKFGQLLSVRRDMVPPDIADELAKLQDEVPPFPWEQVLETVERAFGRPIGEVYGVFESQPIASASVAQVHFATLPDGREVAVKIIRPGIAPVIGEDVALLATLAGWVERTPDGARLRPREVVGEFDKTIHDELDLVREAASASQLGRNFAGSRLLIVPQVHWDWCNPSVMTMERIHGIPVNARARLEAAGIDIKKLARDGVEIFFTQVFRHGFFHADMHPGNIFVAPDGRYCGIDFGIMGTLSDRDKRYLATNFMAFFHRDYRRVATAHIEAGWVPPDTRVDEFEGAIRSVCEPIFDRPLKEIYFGKLLIRLFEVSRRFRMNIQPQLVLLQKTLLQVEGLGRQLDPDLDLRRAAQPILERWMNEQVGVRGLMKSMREEAPVWAQTLPQLPRLLHQVLANTSTPGIERQLERLEAAQRRQTRVLLVLVAVIVLLGAASLLR